MYEHVLGIQLRRGDHETLTYGLSYGTGGSALCRQSKACVYTLYYGLSASHLVCDLALRTMRFSSSTLLLATVSKALGDKHYFFTGFFAGSVIAGVEFDDLTNDLTLVNNITVKASGGSKWIAIDVRAQLF